MTRHKGYQWHGGGIYSKALRRTVGGAPLRRFYGQAWIRGEQRLRHFRLGCELRGAQSRMRQILGDPEKALAERQRGRATLPTFGEVLDDFLANYSSRGGSGYYRMISRRLRERFGSTPVGEVTPRAIDCYVAACREERTRGGRRRLGESTLRKQLTALGTMFRWGMRRGLADANPVSNYDKPRESAERTIAVLSAEQESALRAACPPWVWEVVEWALYSGMRLGEVLGLRWRELDQARGVIHVAGGKTGRSRTVPLHVSERLPAILGRRPRHIGSELVFCERDGRPLDVDALNRSLEGAARAAGIAKERGVLWNRLRHTWATRLLATGKVSIFEVSKWMGNSVAVCEKHYAAYAPGSLQQAAGLLDSAVAAAPPVAPAAEASSGPVSELAQAQIAALTGAPAVDRGVRDAV